MKLFTLSFLFLMGSMNINAQNIKTTDSTYNQTITQADETPIEDEEFGIFLLFIMVAFICCCIGVGIVVTSAVLIASMGLISLGILSTSAIIAIRNKSLTKGFKFLFIALSTIAGTIAGLAFFIFYNGLVRWWDPETTLILGLLSGLTGGLALGFISFEVLKKLVIYIQKRYNIKH